MRDFTCALVAGLMMAPTLAKANDGFQTTDSCAQIFENASDIERVMLGAWVTGYLDSVNNTQSTLIRVDNAVTVMRNVAAFCESNPQATLIQIVQASQKNTPETAGTKANAEAFLNQFLDPSADRIALTAALKPTEADIRAVYAPELAERLIPMYEGMFTPDAQIGPKQGQTQVLVWHGTTGSLRDGDPVLEDFPGGYGDVRPYLQGNFPIVRFKFVEPGETIGMAFDGLIHVNDRWVFMPKPWRALGN
ncbi:hypothetical protein [Roseovarius sp. 2305UL8-3]|uniref:hypothetical protein n=1 Tax=Roseovarius conchicola TaxID=3121636 RepID=UPI003528D14C